MRPLADDIVTYNLPFGGAIGGAGRELVWSLKSLCLCLLSSRPLGENSFFVVSEPSLDRALGVRGGVFFTGGEATPSVSLTDPRLEVNEERAEKVDVLSTGEVGAVDDRRLAAFD